MSAERFSNTIRRLRFENDEMTQEELARKVSVTRQTIIALEAGKYLPSLPLAIHISRVFRVTVEDVFKLEEK
jgi:putative transcriptional regulator